MKLPFLLLFLSLASADTTDTCGMCNYGEKMYKIYCVGCHGADGQGGGLGANLTERLAEKTDDELLITMRDGLGQMPAWNFMMSEEEMRLIITYLRESFEK